MMIEKGKEISKATKEKVQAAKSFIEQRYSKMIQQEQQKKQYWQQLNQKMQSLNLSPLEQKEIKKKINHEEALLLREQRRRMSILDFKSVKIIGKGAFGEVRLCRWNKNSDPVAVKKLKKSEMIFKNKVMQSRQQRNVLAYSQNNPWVVSLKCSFQDADNLYLVMQYLPGGDLMNLLMKKDIFTHEQAQFYTAQMLMALDSVHKMKYIHRDLKPDNVLLDANGHIKLSDFGLCKHTQVRPKRLTDNLVKKESQSSFQKQIQKNTDIGKDYHKRNRKLAYSAVGTPDYVAPEVQGKLGYTETVDWWSMGVILFEMLVGYPPFASQTPRDTWHKIQNWRKYLAIPADAQVSIQAADLIRYNFKLSRKLVTDPSQRLGMNGVDQIKAHPFFTGINWSKLRERKSPYIPEVKNMWDTRNFDPYQQQQPWIPADNKNQKGRKKNTQFIGYTYKPVQQSSSALLKALVDLQSYKIPQITTSNNLEYLQLEREYFGEEYQLGESNNRFKKDKTDRLPKQMYATTTISEANRKKHEINVKRDSMTYFDDTPEKIQKPEKKASPNDKKSSPVHRVAKKSPKVSPKGSPKNGKQSPSAKQKGQTKLKAVKLIQKQKK